MSQPLLKTSVTRRKTKLHSSPSARPKVLNALNALTVQELSRALQSVRDDDDVRVAILTGEGEKAFVAGADINELTALGRGAKPRRCRARPGCFFARLKTAASRSSPPSTALLSAAAANSPWPARSASPRRMPASASLKPSSESSPAMAVSQRLPRLVGKGRALQILLTGEMIKRRGSPPHRPGQ